LESCRGDLSGDWKRTDTVLIFQTNAEWQLGNNRPVQFLSPLTVIEKIISQKYTNERKKLF